MSEMIPSKHVLLRNRGELVGFGKYVLDPVTRQPAIAIHGHHLHHFAKSNEDLVPVHAIQIFTEFENRPYPYAFKSFDDPPELLGDLNDINKCFKHIIAWDRHKLAADTRPSVTNLGSIPRPVSADILNPIVDSIPRSPAKVRFAGQISGPTDEIRPEKRKKISKSIYRSYYEEANSSSSRGNLGSLKDPYLSSDEEDEPETGLEDGRKGSPDKSKQARVSASHLRKIRDECLSPVEKIPKRLMQRKRCGSSELMSRSNQARITPNSSIHQRSNAGVRGEHISRTSNIRSADGQETDNAQLQTHSYASGHDLDLEPGESTAQPYVSSNLGSQTQMRPASDRRNEAHFRSLTANIPRMSLQSSAPVSVSVQPIPLSFPSRNSQFPPSISPKTRQYRFKSRKRASPNAASQRTATRMARLEKSFLENPFNVPRSCCNAGCFYLIDSEYTVIQYRRFLKMDRQERKRALKSMYISNVGAFWFGGGYVCTRFLSRGLGFSNQLQCAVKGTPKARASSSILAVPRELTRETKKNQIILYLRDLAERIGDSLPTKPHTNLPLMSKKQVFERFKKFNRNLDERESPSLSYWCDVWKRICSDIKTHRHHGFTVCDTCERIRMGFETAPNERIEEVLRAEMETHYKFVETERRDYEQRRDLSKRYPTKYLSLIVDGADQKSYGLPHFVFPTKEDKGHKMKMKIVGVLEHGMKKQLTLYTLTEEFESGANHIIEALHRTLGRTKTKRGKLPPVLFVQADNCTRENKNRFFISYLEMLVRKGVFEKVHLSFLPIGHTHSDIDQAFSSVATRFKLERAITSHDMLDLLRNCYNPRAHAEPMDKIANFSGLCAQLGCIRKVTGFSQFRFFRILRKEEGHVPNRNEGVEFSTTIDVKIQALDEWSPMDKSFNKAGFLKFAPDLCHTPVTDTNPPDNVLEVNKHFRSCEHRIQSSEKLELLEDLRDLVYTRRQQPFHWNLETSLEENGDYLVENDDNDDELSEIGPIECMEDENEEPYPANFDYSLNFFIAVKTEQTCPDPFWIARTLRVAEIDDEGNARKLLVRWYQAKEARDAFKSVYEMSCYLRNGERTVFDDTVDVRSILCEFESLTGRGGLHMRTQKAIRQTLNMH